MTKSTEDCEHREDYQLVKLSVYKNGKRKIAYTLIYRTEETKDIPPSKRYLKI